MVFSDYTTPISIDGWIVKYFESGFNGLVNEMFSISILILISVIAAILFSAVIGYEREKNGHPAGLRTHLLIGLGSALIMIISIYAAPGTYQTRDPMRLAAAGVTGIGFLGAGSIIQNGFSIKGLTSAASIWMTMALGMCAGCGYFIIGAVVTLLAYVFLTVFQKIEIKATSKSAVLLVVAKLDEDAVNKIVTVCANMNVKITELTTELVKINDSAFNRIIFKASGNKKGIINQLLTEINKEVKAVECKILH